jgi:hypothetical protein
VCLPRCYGLFYCAFVEQCGASVVSSFVKKCETAAIGCEMVSVST